MSDSFPWIAGNVFPFFIRYFDIVMSAKAITCRETQNRCLTFDHVIRST